jgi:hypothetical protein
VRSRFEVLNKGRIDVRKRSWSILHLLAGWVRATPPPSSSSESEVVQIDINDKAMADEQGNEHIPIVDELVAKLPKPNLSCFVLTHPDLDHCRGFEDLLKRVTIGKAWHTSAWPPFGRVRRGLRPAPGMGSSTHPVSLALREHVGTSPRTQQPATLRTTVRLRASHRRRAIDQLRCRPTCRLGTT